MGNKDESTNLIGRKGSKMTMKSNVKTLALKVYDEQIPDGWEKLKERIKELKKAEYQCLGIKHDIDVLGDDFFEPSTEKPHYHILIRVMQDAQNVSKSGKHVSTILNDLGIVFRKEDATMITNHGIETVGDFGAYATYLTHDTEKAIADGKQHYSTEAIVSNLSPEEILQIRDGYIRVSETARKVKPEELIEIDAYLFELGLNLGDFDEWYNEQCFMLRRHTSMKTLKESYYRGIEARVQKNKFVNRLCIFITGKQNSGKSYTSLETLKRMGYKRIHSVDNGGTGKFDELSPTTQAIIIDDQTAPALLNLCDCKIVKAYRRGSGDRYFAGDMLIVTSNLSFEAWAKDCGCEDNQIEALKSRFYVCELNENGHLNCKSVGYRGGIEEQKERLKKFLKFKTTYDSLITEYNKGNLNRLYAQLINGTDDICKNLMNGFEYKGIESRHEFFDSRGCRHGIKNDKFLLERKQRLEQNEKQEITAEHIIRAGWWNTPESKRQNRLTRIAES